MEEAPLSTRDLAASETKILRFRSLGGPARSLQLFLLCMIPIINFVYVSNIFSFLGTVFFLEQFLGLFMAIVLMATFLTLPAYGKASRSSVAWYDWLLTLCSFTIGLYVLLLFPKIAYQLTIATWDKWILGTLAILLFLEAARRLAGWFLVGTAAVFILYTKFAYLFPGIFLSGEVSWQRISSYSFLDSNALMGLPMATALTIVLPFILFGQVLMQTGGGSFLGDLAVSIMGRFRGGPAKMSVVASCLFGTISGSAVANVVVDGPITINLMKRVGYPSHVAAAIEAVASTGGQIMPPVMGVAAFIMAEFLAIPYAEVALAALVPALLYYTCLLMQVDLEALKGGLTGLPVKEIPRFGSVMKTGWVYLVPFAVLVYTLMILYWPPGKCGIAGVITALLVSCLRKETRPRIKSLLTLLEDTGKALLDISVICGIAGLIIGMIHYSGLALKLSMGLIALCHGNVFILLVLAAAVAIVLGMGMPTAPVYILLAVLVAPTLVQLGIDPLAAHLFIFYFGILSMITPPVCFASYAAASIAGADFSRTGYSAMRLALAAYAVPFLFIYSPSLLLKGPTGQILQTITTATIGVGVLTMGIVGVSFFGRISWNFPQRVLFFLISLLLFMPWLTTNLIGIFLLAVAVLSNNTARKTILLKLRYFRG